MTAPSRRELQQKLRRVEELEAEWEELEGRLEDHASRMHLDRMIDKEIRFVEGKIRNARRRTNADSSSGASAADTRRGHGSPDVSPQADRAAAFILTAGGREPRPNDGEKAARLRQRRDALEDEAREAVELFERASNG